MLRSLASLMIASVVGMHSPTLAAGADSDSASKGSKISYPYSIRLSGGIFRIPGARVSNERVQQMGIRFGRQLGRHLKLELGYATWNAAVEMPGLRAVPGQYFYPPPGQLRERSGFQMIDLNVSTPIAITPGRHFLNAGLAPSYTWGTHKDLVAEGPIINVSVDAGNHKERFFGLCPNLGYTYTLPGGRVFFGGEYMLRWYSGLDQVQHDLSLLAGVNL